VLLVYKELSVEVPILTKESVEQFSMIRDAGIELFIEAAIMDPAEGEIFSDQLKLGRVIANEHSDDGELQLGMVGRYGGGIQNMGSLLRSQVRQMRFYEAEKILFRDLPVMGQGV
jgi:hypothetical protein